METTNPSEVTILGSCVTRDAFNEPYNHGEFRVAEYFARSSLISLASKPITSVPSLLKNPSAFQRRMVERDCDKRFFHNSTLPNSEFVVIDLIDERFDIEFVSEDCAITRSPEWVAAEVEGLESRRKLRAFSVPRFDVWRNAVVDVVDRLKSIVPVRNIVLNEVFWATRSTDDQLLPATFPPKICEIANNELRAMYEIMRGLLPAAQYVTYPPDVFRYDPHHQWGISPFHFAAPVYYHLIGQLRELRLANSKRAENCGCECRTGSIRGKI